MDNESSKEESSSDAPESDSADSRNDKIQNALKSPEKIITSCHGFLLLHKENLKRIIDPYSSDNHPVAFVAVIGPPKSGKSFMTNLIIQLGSNLQGDGGWLESLMKEGEFNGGFRFGSVASSGKLFEPSTSRVTSGIYLWPTPFLMKKANEEKVYIWVLHYRIPKTSSKSLTEDAVGIENFLGLTCSRILEIMTGNQELRIARARRLFGFHGNSLTSPVNVCDSVVVLYSSEDTKNASKILTEVDAKNWLLELGRKPDDINEESILDELKYLNLIRMQKISKPLHDDVGHFNQDAVKPLMKPLRLTVNTLLMEEDEITPKNARDGEICIKNIVEFVDNCVNSVNQLNSIMAEENEMSKVPLKEEDITEQQCEAEVQKTDQNGDARPRDMHMNGKYNADTSSSTSLLETSLDEDATKYQKSYDNSSSFLETSIDEEEKAFKQLELENSVMSLGFPEKAKVSIENESEIFESSFDGENSVTEQGNSAALSNIIQAKFDESNGMETKDALSPTPSSGEESFEVVHESEINEPMEDDTAQEEEAARQLVEENRRVEEEKHQKEENERRLREEEERKLEMERQREEADLEKANERLKIAVPHVKQMMRRYSLYWINTDGFHPQNVQNYKAIYHDSLTETLNESYRDEVASDLWDNFCEAVHKNCFDDCNTFLTAAFEPVCQLNVELGRQLHLYGYFPPETFETMASKIAANCMTVQAKNDPEILELMSTAMANLLKIYKVINETLMDTEKAIRETAGLRVRNFYNEEMKRYLGENGAFSKQEFYEVHCDLVRRLLESSRKILNPSAGSTFPNDVQEWLSNLERELNDAFAGHKESNELKLVMLQKQINKLVSARYDEYVTRIECILQKNPDGCDQMILEREHRTFSKEQEDLLALDIKKKIRQTEPTEGHCEALLHQINQYWPTVEKVNQQNVDRRRKLMEEERIRKLEQERVQQMQFENRRPFPTSQKPHQGSRMTKVNLENHLAPLIFRLSYSHIAMGTVIDGNFRLLNNSMGEHSTPIVVALNKNGELVYGTEAMTSYCSQEYQWWITNYLGRSSGQSIRKKIEIRQGTLNHVYEISVEFLLSYLMRSLKDQAENLTNGNFISVVITIPYWFCSIHRIQVKDAARVAGFEEVHLINEESACAYACASSQLRANFSGRLLVLSENFGIISSTLYKCSENNPRKIAMIAQNFAYSQVERKKGLQQWLKHPVRSFKDVVLGETPKLDKEAKLHLVRKLCSEMFHNSRFSADNWSSDNIVLFLTDSESVEEGNSEWLQIFNDVVRDRGYGRVSELGANGTGYPVLLGASMLSPFPEKIGEYIRDALAREVFKLGLGNAGESRKYAIHMDEVPFLPEKSRICQQELQKMVRDVKFFQLSPFDENQEIPVGRLELGSGTGISNTLKVYPALEISSEAVVTLKEVKCDQMNNRKSPEKDITNDYQWTSPNIGDVQRDGIIYFVNLLMEHSSVFKEQESESMDVELEIAVEAEPEDPELKDAKAKLLEAIREIEQCIEIKKYNFKTEVSAELLKKKVEKARHLVQNGKAEASLEEIRKEIETLKKSHLKYSKA